MGAGANGDSEVDANFYRERLMVLRARCGLDNAQVDVVAPYESMKSNLLSSVKAQDSGSNSSLSSNSSTGMSLVSIAMSSST